MIAKRILAGMLALTLTLSSGAVFAGAEEFEISDESGIVQSADDDISENIGAVSGDYEYEVNGDTVTITKYNGNDSVVSIPSKIAGKKVTKITAEFKDCKNVTKVIIPDTVTALGGFLFSECENLKSVKLPKNLTKIGLGLFSFCPKLTDVTIPQNVTAIESIAFAQCTSLKSINIPDTVKTIEAQAFYRCTSLTSINIPKNVKTVVYDAFYGCENLRSINVESGNKNYCSQDGVLFNSDKTDLIQFPSAYAKTSYTLPKSVEYINHYAFFKCKNMKNLTIKQKYISFSTTGIYECPDLTIHCTTGSGAEYYAIEHDIKYKLTDAAPTPAKVKISGSSSSTSAIRVKWNKAKDASGYRIYIYDQSTDKWEKYKTLSGGSTTECRVTGLKAGSAYGFKVQAYAKKSGNTAWGEVSETYTAATKPLTVKITKAGRSTTSVRLYWNGVSCSGYKIQQYNPATKSWKTIKLLDSNAMDYKISGLKRNTSYKFRIQAYKKAGGKTLKSDWSAAKTVTTKK